MMPIYGLDYEIYADKVKACWIGKNIGGTLGAPFEGVSWPLKLEFYDPVPKQPIPNDDIELQLVWLCLVEKYGLGLNHQHLEKAWKDNIRYGMDEYGVAKWNIARGFHPPVTGIHNNWFVDGMGAAIRSEIWACLFPGKPKVAAHFARLDASVDHCGDGVWAEMFLAAMESAAFSANIKQSISSGLAVIPDDCRLSNSVKRAIELAESGIESLEARQKLVFEYGNNNFTDSVLNIGFIVLGLIYGNGDFDKTILTAVNCGMDTDCTGASAGAFMGILLGSAGISEKWRSVVSEKIAVSDGICGLDFPTTTEDLSARNINLCSKLQEELTQGFEPDISVLSLDDPIDDCNKWLVFPVAGEPFEIPTELKASEKKPDDFADNIVNFKQIHLDLSPYCKEPKAAIHLLTFITADVNIDGFLMICADTGITAWLDDEIIINYHGRNLSLPACHRTEGGGTVPVKLKAGRKYVLKVRMSFCRAPLKMTAAVLDKNNHYVNNVAFGLLS